MNDDFDGLNIKVTMPQKVLGANWQQISLQADSLQIDQRTIALTDITTPVELDDGMTSSTLMFLLPAEPGNETGESLQIKALTKSDANKLCTEINRLRFLLLEDAVFTQANLLKQQLSDRHYLRQQRFQQIRSEAQAAIYRFGPAEQPGADSAQAPLEFLHRISGWPDDILDKLHQRFFQRQGERYSQLFDSIESHPLTEQQRHACLLDEENNLVLAGAGTGKTSTMIGRAAYLISDHQASPQQILMLAFAGKAAAEMRERLQQKLGDSINGLNVQTFHALGRMIIAQVEGQQPAMTLMAEDERLQRNFVEQSFNHLLQRPDYLSDVLDYFVQYLYADIDPFRYQREGDHLYALTENEVKTLKGETVASVAEALIGNFLFRHGIEYNYQAGYQQHPGVAGKPLQGAIFLLPEEGTCIHYMPLDHNGAAPQWFSAAELLEDHAKIEQQCSPKNWHLIRCDYAGWKSGQLTAQLAERMNTLEIELEPLPDKAVLETLREFGALKQVSDLLAQMLKHAKSSNMDSDKLVSLAQASSDPGRMNASFKLLQPVTALYQENLEDAGQIDFDDMINRAIHYVRSGRFQSPWVHILVDEFQDISASRAELIKVLKEQPHERGRSLFCVGDDWQSIYRFSGSDISLTIGFSEYFGPTRVIALDRTYRFNNAICDLASRFVCQNPAQIDKVLQTHSQVEGPAVSLLRSSYSPKEAIRPLREVLTRINQIVAGQDTTAARTVYLLARYSFSLPDRSALDSLNQQYQYLNIDAMTAHASKGKEADYVVVLDMVSGRFGFPSEKQTHPLLDAILPAAEPYPDAEERRLFYVALTRARHRVYLISDMTRPSRFINELLQPGISWKPKSSDRPTSTLK